MYKVQGENSNLENFKIQLEIKTFVFELYKAEEPEKQHLKSVKKAVKNRPWVGIVQLTPSHSPYFH